MRIPTLALLALLGSAAAANAVADGDWHILPPLKSGIPDGYPFQTGVAATAGREAAYLRKLGGDPRAGATAARHLAVEAWRGKRVRLTLPVKLEGEGTALAWAWVGKSNDIFLRAAAQKVAAGGDWQPQQFVLDVPADAQDLAVDLHLAGKASTLWAGEIRLEAVGADVPASRMTRLDLDGPIDTGGGGGGPTYTPPR
jgi:hypothetical protein